MSGTTVRLLAAKLHRLRVTRASRDYMGSITIDPELLDAVGIMPLQEVEVVNVENGKRWTTHVLPGTPGHRQVCPNGGGARLCEPGDELVVCAYTERDPAAVARLGHTARVAVTDDDNRVTRRLRLNLSPGPDGELRYEESPEEEPPGPLDATATDALNVLALEYPAGRTPGQA